jgi:hypothetical protein
MDAGLRTPLLDFFRRGEVARDVRLSAAQGAFAARPLEQLGLLVLLTTDTDEEVRAAADGTLKSIPPVQLGAVIARADTPTDIREFFVARGIAPVVQSGTDSDAPLVDTDATDYGAESQTEEDKLKVAKQIVDMTVPEKVKAAMKGTREMRAQLIRDPNKMVAAAVLSCPRVTEQEIEGFARMANVSEDILRAIAYTRAWIKNYNVVLGLVKNPKTPVALSLNLLARLNDRDARGVSIDRNVPEPLRIAARKRVVLGQK